MSRSEQLRQLAVQLASLASLEDVVTHGIQSLLESPSGLIAPKTTDERALPASLSRPRSRSGRSLLSQRGPTGLAVKSCPPAPPKRSGSSHHRSDSPAPAPGLKESAGASSSARAASLPTPRATAAKRPPPSWLVGDLLAPLRQRGAARTVRCACVRPQTDIHRSCNSSITRLPSMFPTCWPSAQTCPTVNLAASSTRIHKCTFRVSNTAWFQVTTDDSPGFSLLMRR